MGAIAGICYWDGRPIAEQDLRTLAAHSRPGGPDGGGTSGPIPGLALQAHVLHFDRLSTMERQPYAFDRGSVLTFDGRLDNREDLLTRLHRDLGSDITDPALVAAAYARWGDDMLPRLIGDWSLAIWDAPNRRLVLARDYMGNRPLHYVELPGGLAWATSLDALADVFDLYKKPDEDFIAAQLTRIVPADLTPFQGARALRSGHLLVATPNTSLEVRRYWTFHPAQIRYRTLHDYADHARELLTEAVRVRLRAQGRVWSHLSGGFDSSSMVCLAQTLITRDCVDASALQPISQVCSDSPESDESFFITAVERWCGLTTIRREWKPRVQSFQELLARPRPFSYRTRDAFEAPMVAAGDRIVMSGEGGDLVMVRGSSQVVSLVEALHEGRPVEFLKLCLARARRRHGQLPPLLVHLAVKAYLPQLETRRSARPRNDRVIHATGVYCEPTVAERVTPALLARALKHPECPNLSEFPVAKRALVRGLYGFMDHQATSNPDGTLEIWRTFPYTHRPLVEFIIGVPQLAFWDPVATRAGMKRALADVLPPELLARRSKGDPDAAKARRDLAQAADYARVGLPPEPPVDWLLVKRGYVRSEPLATAANATAAGLPPSTFLRQSVNVEAWLRAAEGVSSVTHSPPARDRRDLVGAARGPLARAGTT